jgi:fibronectin type 3 domain-containing protein
MAKKQFFGAVVFLAALHFLAVFCLPHTILRAATTTHSVVLSWVPPADGTAASDSYSVLRGTVAGSHNTTVAAGLDMGCTSNANCTYTDTTVANGTTYYYVVEAVNTNGTSLPSSEASATIPGNPPAAPTGLKAVVN